MADPAFSLCVYCGSRPGENPLFADAARAVGTWIGAQGGQLVYGGGSSGLMGIVAQATAQAGGRVVGVIPQTLVDKEYANHACDELHIVQTMHERKALMAEFEVWTWRQLGYHDKPIGLLNVAGYYDGLLAFLHTSVGSGFMGPWQMDLVHASTSVDTLLPNLVRQLPASPNGSELRAVI